ncbi:hypothetical protein D3C76_868700 [compost metagenome]
MDIFLADHLVDLRTPLVDRFGHERRLQQGAHLAVLVTVHSQDDQSIEKRTKALSDETVGVSGAVAQHAHHVLVLEQREGRARALLSARIGRHAELGDEIAFVDG